MIHYFLHVLTPPSANSLPKRIAQNLSSHKYLDYKYDKKAQYSHQNDQVPFNMQRESIGKNALIERTMVGHKWMLFHPEQDFIDHQGLIFIYTQTSHPLFLTHIINKLTTNRIK